MDPFNHFTPDHHHQRNYDLPQQLGNLTISVTPRVNPTRRSRPRSAYDSDNTKACLMMTPSPTVLHHHQMQDSGSPHESLCSSGVCSDLTRGGSEDGSQPPTVRDPQQHIRVAHFSLHNNDIECRSDVRDFASGDSFLSPTLVQSHHHHFRNPTPVRRRHPELTPVMPKDRDFTLNLTQSARLPRDTSMVSKRGGLASAATTPTCAGPSKGPQRSVSMTRLYQLAQPRKRYLEETLKWRAEHLGNVQTSASTSNAMTQSLMVPSSTNKVKDDPMIRSCNDLLPSPAATSKAPASLKKKTPRRPRPVSMNLTPVSESQRDSSVSSSTAGEKRQKQQPSTTNRDSRKDVQPVSKTPSAPKGASKAHAVKTPRVTQTQVTTRNEKDDAAEAEMIKKKEEEFKRKREEKRREEETRRRLEEERLRLEAEKEAELKRQEEERLRKEEEERIKREEEEAARLEEEQKRLAEELRKAEEEKLRKAIEEQQRKQEEERKRMEEENQLRLEREEQERRAREEAERARVEREEKLRKDEEERLLRKKRLEDIMARTRKTPGGPKSSNPAEDSSDTRNTEDHHQHNNHEETTLQPTAQQVVPSQTSSETIITSTDSNGNATTSNGGTTINNFHTTGEVAF